MASNQMHELLEKYWEGETSLQEEQLLRNYFTSDEVSSDLKQYQPLFQFFKTEQDNQLPNNFEEEVLQKIKTEVPQKTIVRKLYFHIARSAAIVLVMVAAYFSYSSWNVDKSQIHNPNMVVYDDNPQDAKEAYLAYKEALKLVSKKMDKGTSKAAFGLGQIKKASKIIK